MKKEKAISLLNRQIDQITNVKATARFGATFKKWNRDARVALQNIFPDRPQYVQEFSNINYQLRISTGSTPDSSYQRAYDHGLEHAEVFLRSCIDEIEEYWEESTELTPTQSGPDYVDPDRIAELKVIEHSSFDLAKLIRLCEELNVNQAAGNTYSVIMLVRAILDHIPPVFAAKDFAQVASQIGGKSKKSILDRLERVSRELANVHLHQQIRNKEPLPNPTQMNFSSELDFMLCEVIHALEGDKRSNPTKPSKRWSKASA